MDESMGTHAVMVIKSLKTDDLLSIFVGSQETPYHVSQAMLERTSDRFVTACDQAHKDSVEDRTLQFPEDDVLMWEAFLYWVVEKQLSEKDDKAFLANCWIVGEKYSVPKYQDDVMLKLLRSLHPDEYGEWEPSGLKILDFVPKTTSCSAMRKLLAEEVVLELEYRKDYSELEKYAGFDFLAEIYKARDLYALERHEFRKRFKGYRPEEQRWRRFMTGC